MISFLCFSIFFSFIESSFELGVGLWYQELLSSKCFEEHVNTHAVASNKRRDALFMNDVICRHLTTSRSLIFLTHSAR
ncbi:hypothetical protein METBIDRAFT_164531 [Metschnikowia bicuspidata var. bicuspidata NRRL YB-4993]|uniref:Secreted protein n=1 Tax=Metschnikowia bicuspidata var. bicuspidata NRRL YB-4993 TaxID=869754 RepID=A0A1A0HAD7_9ASCO|nr:hypothetical protein METBIDRAFT_164531 [Metschnikowia bicuspidata var. bicuspidata NRRL YB-4993]OBA20838.1 hypothetical protein METBIDRAFT_164531 [Metschnikowia bicuspidata var. bicuspidata NRRL YB-4993]